MPTFASRQAERMSACERIRPALRELGEAEGLGEPHEVDEAVHGEEHGEGGPDHGLLAPDARLRQDHVIDRHGVTIDPASGIRMAPVSFKTTTALSTNSFVRASLTGIAVIFPAPRTRTALPVTGTGCLKQTRESTRNTPSKTKR